MTVAPGPGSASAWRASPAQLAGAHRSYDQAAASPLRELRMFTRDEGGAQHIGLDHLPYVSAYIADWVSGVFGRGAAER
jgi:hypothetical protein